MKELMNGGNHNCNENDKRFNNLNKKEMIKVNSIEEVKQVFNRTRFDIIGLGLGIFENIELYADTEVINNLPSEFETKYDGEIETILIKKNPDNTISLTRPEEIIMSQVQDFVKNVNITKWTDEHTYMVECGAFGKYLFVVLEWLRANNMPLPNNKYIDSITVNQVPDVDENIFQQSASYVVITK